MKTQLTDQDALHIDAGIQEKYGHVAQGPAGHFTYPTGQEGLEKLGYDMDIVNNLPPATVAAYCGVGNPFSLGAIKEGQFVLDIGCGAGIDLLIAAQIVGPKGRVVGIDMVAAMLDRAQEHIKLAAADHTCVQKGSAEELEFPDNTFDVVISNGVFNLVLDKTKALSEVLRVLKPGGRLMIADQVMIGTQVKDIKTRVATWFQ